MSKIRIVQRPNTEKQLVIMTKQDSVAPDKSAQRSESGAQRGGAKGAPRDTSAVGLNPIKRDAMGAAMRVLTKITGSELAEKFNLRQTIDRVTYEAPRRASKPWVPPLEDSRRSRATAHPSACPTTRARTPTTSI